MNEFETPEEYWWEYVGALTPAEAGLTDEYSIRFAVNTMDTVRDVEELQVITDKLIEYLEEIAYIEGSDLDPNEGLYRPDL